MQTQCKCNLFTDSHVTNARARASARKWKMFHFLCLHLRCSWNQALPLEWTHPVVCRFNILTTKACMHILSDEKCETRLSDSPASILHSCKYDSVFVRDDPYSAHRMRWLWRSNESTNVLMTSNDASKNLNAKPWYRNCKCSNKALKI